MGDIFSRLKKFIDYLRVSNNEFGRSIGCSSAQMTQMLTHKKNFGIDKLLNIISIYPQLNPNWLLTGEGPMLKDGQEDKVTTNAMNTSNTQIAHTSTGIQTENNILLYTMYSDLQKKDAKIEFLTKELTEFKLRSQKQEADIKKLVKALEYYENIDTIQNFSMEQEHRVGDVPFVESLSPTPPPSARVNVRIEKGKNSEIQK